MDQTVATVVKPQNVSAAVMNQRREDRDSLDDFPTPPWATRQMIDWLHRAGIITQAGIAREPCCGRGFMSRPLAEYFPLLLSTDIHDYGYQDTAVSVDYLSSEGPMVDHTFTNPPYRLAEKFIAKMIEESRHTCGVFVRSNFSEGQGRYHRLYSVTPPTFVLQFAERVVLSRGIVRDPDLKYWRADPKHPDGGKMVKPSTATASCWMIWAADMPATPGEARTIWLPPARRLFERDGDYDLPEGCAWDRWQDNEIDNSEGSDT